MIWKGTNAVDVEKATAAQIQNQGLLENTEKAMEALGVFLNRVKKNWKKLDNRVLGHILRSPALSLGVGEHRFMEDCKFARSTVPSSETVFRAIRWTSLDPAEFTAKWFSRGDANWESGYPEDSLLPLTGIITDDVMHKPDMWDSDGEPCLSVVKSDNATVTTIGRANGAFSIVRDYFNDMAVNQTSTEWGIIN
ncbi:hypothetical protein HWV62_38100 [Athelia sp. TMB]|nr:hypothetical protein HWV62_38100 [Athelia sp. TMB]